MWKPADLPKVRGRLPFRPRPREQGGRARHRVAGNSARECLNVSFVLTDPRDRLVYARSGAPTSCSATPRRCGTSWDATTLA